MIDIISVFYDGVLILVVAIIMNLIANYFKITTWFTFVDKISKLGLVRALKSQKLLDLTFLFIIYPFMLGFAIILPEVLYLG